MAEEKRTRENAARGPRLGSANAPARRAREAELAAALRANLARRKADLAQREAAAGEGSGAEPGEDAEKTTDAAKPRDG